MLRVTKLDTVLFSTIALKCLVCILFLWRVVVRFGLIGLIGVIVFGFVLA